MNKENRELLEEVTKQRLEAAQNAQPGSEESTAAIAEATKLLEKGIELQKLDDEKTIETQRLENEAYQMTSVNAHNREEEALKAKELKDNVGLKVLELVAVGVIAPAISAVGKAIWAKIVCDFERKDDGYFASTVGKSLSGLFRFKN